MNSPPSSNRHGLQRHIPAEVKLEVRQRCGFGCVICGTAIYEYEHFNPDYCDATEHSPQGITLLCPTCNQKRKRGTLSRESVAAADQVPRCHQEGFAREVFDFSPDGVEVKFGGFTLVNSRLSVGGTEVLSFRPPAEVGLPVRLNAILTDIGGAPLVRIEDNDWKVPSDRWDVRIVGKKLEILSEPRNIAVSILFHPPKGIEIEKCRMRFNGREVVVLPGATQSLGWEIVNCRATSSDVQL